VIKNPGYLYRLPAELENAHYRAQLEKERAAVRESEARTSALLRAIPDLMFVQSDDGVYLDYYARNIADLLVPPEAFLGKNMRDVLPAPIVERMVPCFEQARHSMEPQVAEYSLELGGQTRYYEARVVSVETGKVLSIVREVTDQKLAQQSLAQSNERVRLLAGRLIAAQEEERIRIANELHDDLSQRMAALAINLTQLRHQLTDPPALLYPYVAALEREAVGLVDRTRALSHQLHSAVLEHVGLPAALKSFCSEFPALDVELEIGAIAPRLAPSIQLCFYRVVQEALTNARRHSGASRAQVKLQQTDDLIELTVHDAGTGFDPERVRHKGGLGLISLEERVRLVGGSLQIESGPGQGTQLRVRVPCVTPANQA
jgi:signal transduction histidine kinase